MFAGQVLGYAPLPMQPVRLDLEKQSGPDGSQMVMRLDRKLSLETVHNFIQTLRPEPAAHLILDLRGVSFLHSAGVSALQELFVPPRNPRRRLARTCLHVHSSALLHVRGPNKRSP